MVVVHQRKNSNETLRCFDHSIFEFRYCPSNMLRMVSQSNHFEFRYSDFGFVDSTLSLNRKTYEVRILLCGTVHDATV